MFWFWATVAAILIVACAHFSFFHPVIELGTQLTHWLGCLHDITCWGCRLQDIFVGAWQQAKPNIDQVPFTFPPVSCPSKLGRGKKTQKGAFKNKGPRTNGGQYDRLKQRGHGFMMHEADAKFLLHQPKPPKEKHLKHVKGRKLDARSGVSAVEYAKALDQEL